MLYLIYNKGDIAQLVERLPYKQDVPGSKPGSPISASLQKPGRTWFLCASRLVMGLCVVDAGGCCGAAWLAPNCLGPDAQTE